MTHWKEAAPPGTAGLVGLGEPLYRPACELSPELWRFASFLARLCSSRIALFSASRRLLSIASLSVLYDSFSYLLCQSIASARPTAGFCASSLALTKCGMVCDGE